MTDLDLRKLIGAALMVPPTDNWHYPLSENQLRHLITQAVEAEREACIKVIKAYQIPIGNSAAGEMARDWTVDALKYIRDEIRARGESK
jgi:hypothetical protein